MRRRLLAPVLVLLLAMPAALRAADAPRVERDADRWVLTGLPPILGDEEVRTHLGSGLTSTFVFRAGCRDRQGNRQSGGARIQVRYELWDEVFHAASLDVDGRVERRVLGSLEELSTWWNGLRLTLFSPPPDLAESSRIRLTVDLVPFSRAEQDDAQTWFSDSLDQAGRSSAEELESSVDESPDRLARVFHLLMATSIKRRATSTYRYTLIPPSGRKS